MSKVNAQDQLANVPDLTPALEAIESGPGRFEKSLLPAGVQPAEQGAKQCPERLSLGERHRGRE